MAPLKKIVEIQSKNYTLFRICNEAVNYIIFTFLFICILFTDFGYCSYENAEKWKEIEQDRNRI